VPNVGEPELPRLTGGGAAQTLGPLDGIPLAVKDNFCTAGVRTTAGSVMLKEHRPIYDATLVARWRAAGAVLMGKTNMVRASDRAHLDACVCPLSAWSLSVSNKRSVGDRMADPDDGKCRVSIAFHPLGPPRPCSHVGFSLPTSGSCLTRRTAEVMCAGRVWYGVLQRPQRRGTVLQPLAGTR
jgi:hypothetical protein